MKSVSNQLQSSKHLIIYPLDKTIVILVPVPVVPVTCFLTSPTLLYLYILLYIN